MSVEKLDEHDLVRHQRMQTLLPQVQAIQKQIDELVLRQQHLAGAYKIWAEELHERYDLKLDGSEGVDQDGVITRV